MAVQGVYPSLHIGITIHKANAIGTTVSSEPWQQYVCMGLHNTPIYATLHMALITILPTLSYQNAIHCCMNQLLN